METKEKIEDLEIESTTVFGEGKVVSVELKRKDGTVLPQAIRFFKKNGKLVVMHLPNIAVSLQTAMRGRDY